LRLGVADVFEHEASAAGHLRDAARSPIAMAAEGN